MSWCTNKSLRVCVGSAGIFIAVAITRVSACMYNAWYYNRWESMCCSAWAAVLTLASTFSSVLDTGPGHPSYWQKNSKKSLQLAITFKEKLVKNLKLPKLHKIFYFTLRKRLWKTLNYQNEMSEMSWAVILGLTLIICTELNKVELSLWDLSYYVALRELKYAIYDGLEMKLKVTKMSSGDDYVLTTVYDDDDEWSVRLSWVLHLLCILMWGLERNPECH